MRVRRALFQTGKVTLIFVGFVALLAILLIFQHGFGQFTEMYLTAYVAKSVLAPTLIVAIVSFIVCLIPR